jgi:tetratricopeptide (TPR) repeat protein
MRRLRFALIPFVLLLAAAVPMPDESPDDLIRRANSAFLRGDVDAADSLYTAAEGRTGDPGLVAFNKAAVLFQKDEFYAAELHYARSLDDKACPPDRAARAWFNRGTCLVRRGGSAGVFRSAIACFERCLDSSAADEPLKADARYNLELAKLLWAEANKKAAKPETPNFPTHEDEKPDSPASQEMGTEPGSSTEQGNDANPGTKDNRSVPAPMPGSVQKNGQTGSTAMPADVPNPQMLLDESTPQKLSEEETRAYLRRTEERLREERRRMLRVLYGPDRPGFRDW